MTEIANVPEHDKFQIFTPHSDGELVYPEHGYLGIDYTTKIIFIQVFWVAGRTTDAKKAFYRRIADDLHAKIGVRKQDVWITLADNAREDWSFGKGEMQYAPK
jgi:phenylpyruvate tautomerase PptA (4-oxalocrotonate tautomerase family)